MITIFLMNESGPKNTSKTFSPFHVLSTSSPMLPHSLCMQQCSIVAFPSIALQYCPSASKSRIGQQFVWIHSISLISVLISLPNLFLWIACCVYLLAFGMGSKPCELQESNVITWNFLVYDIALPMLVFWVKRNTGVQIQIQNKVKINLVRCTETMS